MLGWIVKAEQTVKTEAMFGPYPQGFETRWDFSTWEWKIGLTYSPR